MGVRNETMMEGNASPTIKQLKGHEAWRAPPEDWFYYIDQDLVWVCLCRAWTSFIVFVLGTYKILGY